MSKDEKIIASAKMLLNLGVLTGPIGTALSFALMHLVPKLIVKAVELTRYPIIFQGHIVNYADPCGICDRTGYEMYRLYDSPYLAYCPGCRTIHSTQSPTGSLELAY